MQTSAREAYLATQVMTATPQKLQLLLVEGAIRSIQKTLRHWESQEEEAGCEALIHAQEIVSELLTGVSGKEHEISHRLASVYLYLFRNLSEAQLEHDAQKLHDTLRVLEIERETWQQVCQKFGAEVAHTSNSAASLTLDAQPTAPTKIAPPLTHLTTDLPQGGFSYEA